MDAPLAVLMWDRGALEVECDRSAPVREGVETYLGRSVFGDAGDTVVRVTLARVEEQGRARVEARVTQEDAQGRTWGERTVTGGDACDSLDEELTLVIALMVDAPATSQSPEPETPAPPPPPPRVAPEEPERTEILTVPSLERPAPSPGHAVLLGFGAAALGATPEVGVGGGVMGIFKPRGFWGFGVEATWLAPRRQSLDGGSLEVSALLAGANLCPLLAVEDGVWWSICGSFHVARLHARSRELLGSRTDAQLFAAPGVVLRGGRILGSRYLLAGGLQLSVPVSPDRYVYRDRNGDRLDAFEVGSFVVLASVGLGIISR